MPDVHLIARCGPRGKGSCRVHVAVPVNTDGLATVHYVNGVSLAAPKDAVPYMVWCLAHHYPMQAKVIRATYATGPCGPDCREAEGTICKCSCMGAHHGIEAR